MYSVLIVDDLAVMRMQIKRLKIWGTITGFSIVAEAENGLDALQKLRMTPVDLVITDIKMPFLNGIELTKIVKDEQLAHCVVLLSDYTDFNHVREGFISGAYDFLAKPIEVEPVYKLLLRVDQQLKTLKCKEESLKKLQGMLEEKSESFYPISDIDLIIDYIESGNYLAIETLVIMIQSINISVGNDLIKARLIVSKAVRDITDSILCKYTWINQFIDTMQLKNVDCMKCQNEEALIMCAMEVTKKLVLFMNAYMHSDESNPLVRQVCQYVVENIDHAISVREIAKKMFISKNYLSVLFKERTGIMLTEYLTMIKIERAKKLILDNDLKNYQVAQQVGFKDIEYFSKLFRRYEGISPSEYRQDNIK